MTSCRFRLRVTRSPSWAIWLAERRLGLTAAVTYSLSRRGRTRRASTGESRKVDMEPSTSWGRVSSRDALGHGHAMGGD
jgi:hypothetical protein